MATSIVLLVLLLSSGYALYEFPITAKLSGIDQPTLNQLRQINDDKVRKSISMAERSVNSSVNVETNILRSVRVNENTISYGQWLQGYPILEARKNNYVAAVMLKSSLYVLNKECREKRLNDIDCAKFISTLKVPNSGLKDRCEEAVQENAEKGLHSYRRLLPAHYKDGLQAIRTSATPRKSLPSSRQLSEKFYNAGIKATQVDSNHQHPFELSKQPNLILPQWTYFIEHDLTKTVVGTMINGEPIECCNDVNLPVSPRHLHPACYPLQITEQDSFYGQLGVTCLNYVRSALAVDIDCKLGPAQQLSEATGIFDLSQLYGYNQNITDSLRTHVKGELRKSSGKKSSSLPSTDASDQFCMHTEKKRACYMAGDPRINLNPYTTVIYAIFHKSHNQIAVALSALYSHWDDAKLFSVARSINVGLYQHVIYREWVENVLDKTLARSLLAEEFDEHLDQRVSNEFATAGIRFSNSMIPGDLFAIEDQMHGEYGNLLESSAKGQALQAASKLFSLKDVFFKPKNLLKRKFAKSMVKASMVEKAMRLDTSFVDDFSSQLFKAEIRNGKNFGTDSLALDIQRGRDHGLSPYVEYVKVCQKKHIQRWADLEGIVYDHDLATMKEVYHTVADIDLIVGLLAEIPSNQSLVGATLSCVLAEQLSNAKRADRAFYTRNLDGRVLETVTGYTGAKLLCDTLELDTVTKNIFRIPSVTNHMIMCNDPSLTGLNLSVWKDK